MTGNTVVSKAAGTSGSVTGEGTARAGEGLNNPTTTAAELRRGIASTLVTTGRGIQLETAGLTKMTPRGL